MERFKLSERQAQAILELMLQRLTSLEREKIEQEYREVMKTIARLQDILGADSPATWDGGSLGADPTSSASTAGSPARSCRSSRTNCSSSRPSAATAAARRSAAEAEDINVEDLIAEEEMVITMTRDGYIKRLPLDTYRTQGRGGKGVIGLNRKEEDVGRAPLRGQHPHHHPVLHQPRQGVPAARRTRSRSPAARRAASR